MTDIVDRLRDPYIVLTSMVVRLEAADEIERLREATPDRFYEISSWCDRLQAENERLHSELERLHHGYEQLRNLYLQITGGDRECQSCS